MPRLSSNTIELEYEEYGAIDAPLVILICGLGEQMGGVEFPKEFCVALADRSLRVVRFDNRDVGLSSHLHGTARGTYNYCDMADDVAGLIGGLGGNHAHIVGASMGGFIGRWLALRHPSLVQSLAIIMSGCGASLGSSSAKQFSQMAPHAMQNMLSKTRVAASKSAAVESYVEAWRSYNGSRFDFDEEWVRACALSTYSRAYDPEGVGRQVAASKTPDLLEAQSEIRCDAVVIHGDEDPIFGADHARETASRISGAHLEVISGMGHEMPPEIWPRIIELVSERSLDAAAV
jgi:pimeloyl-ACP methyl ester carboxylesterase